jgi:nucleotide-binding universal stress UspA family protein
MFHDIVVPLDGSSLAECALGPAGYAARECWARLHLIRVHVTRGSDTPAQDAVSRAGAERYLQGMASWLRESGEYEVRIAVLDGSPALAIADYADRVEADLIVMTTHGRTGVQRRRLGSVASVVAHHVQCPVVLTRGEAGEYVPPRTPFTRILIAMDGIERADVIREVALQLGSLGHPSFRLLYTMSPALVPQLVHAGAEPDAAEAAQERALVRSAETHAGSIANRLRAAGLRAEVIVSVTEDPARAVLETAEREGADAVVLLRHEL